MSARGGHNHSPAGAGLSQTLSNGSVLLVEAHREALRAMSILLKAEGISTITAENGAEALTKIKTQGPIGLVLLDLVMPVMNGWEVSSPKKR